MATRTAALALGLGIVTLGCAGPSRFRPTVPMRTRSADLQLELGELGAGRGQELVFRSRSTAPHVIRNAWLTVPDRAPCSGGREVARILIDGQATPSLSPGTHEVRFELEGNGDMHLDLVLDLGLDDGGCARAPVLSQSLALSAPNRLLLVASGGVDGGESLRGLRALFGFRVGLGGWLGRVLVLAEAGVGSAQCYPSTCGKDSNGNLNSHVTFPLAAGASYAFPPTRAQNIMSVWMIGASYGYTPVTLPATSGERRFDVHTVHLTPGWATAFFYPGHGPFVDLHHIALGELYFPLGIAIDPGGPSRKVGFSGGIAFRLLLPL